MAGRKAGRVGVVVANANARGLRKRLTPQEVKLWVGLRELKPLGFHFRRQAPIGRYIVDFASFGSRVVVEVDGGQHNLPEGAQSDLERDAFLQSQGFRVLRYWNSDVDQNLEGVMESIFSAFEGPHPGATRRPSPRSGYRIHTSQLRLALKRDFVLVSEPMEVPMAMVASDWGDLAIGAWKKGGPTACGAGGAAGLVCPAAWRDRAGEMQFRGFFTTGR